MVLYLVITRDIYICVYICTHIYQVLRTYPYICIDMCPEYDTESYICVVNI